MRVVLRNLTRVALAIALTVSGASAMAAGGSCPVRKAKLTEEDLEIARVAWKYMENNHNLETGLINAVNNYPSTTMWDTGSVLAAILTAHEVGFIQKKRFDEMVSQILTTLEHLQLFNGDVPNKVYNTKNGMMVNYANRPSEKGIGVSALDLGRMISWFNILSCLHPQHKEASERVLATWNYCPVIRSGQMYGMAWNEGKTKAIRLQEGRLGYEQYAGKVFRMMGFNQDISATYHNKFTTTAKVESMDIYVDKRDAMTLGANNYVVAESYAMDAKENGIDAELKPILEKIYRVQEKRWQRTKIVTAVSEDNVDRRPYFVYNTIFSNGEPWAAINDMGEDFEELKTTSTKAALSMAYLFPDRPYSKVMKERIWDARNPKGGWYSGVYEDHKGFNTATTGNTNGVIMSLILGKLYGSLNAICSKCKKGVSIKPELVASVNDLKACAAARPTRLAAHDKRVKKGRDILDKQIEIAKAIARKESAKDIDALIAQIQGFEAQAKAGKGKEAGAGVKGLKRTIWNMSMKLESEQKALRSLMGPIDALSGKWTYGGKASSADLRGKLKAVADRLRAGG